MAADCRRCARLLTALEIIAGYRQPVDNLLSNSEIATLALAPEAAPAEIVQLAARDIPPMSEDEKDKHFVEAFKRSYPTAAPTEERCHCATGAAMTGQIDVCPRCFRVLPAADEPTRRMSVALQGTDSDEALARAADEPTPSAEWTCPLCGYHKATGCGCICHRQKEQPK